MIKSAHFSNFTTVPNDDWQFSSHLNIIIGENATGKSHVLKVLYSLLKVLYTNRENLTKTYLEKAFAEKLLKVFRPESLGRLVKRRQGRERCEISLEMSSSQQNVTIRFASNAKSLVEVISLPQEPLQLSPVFLPSRELITLCPWFQNLYDNYYVEFEETWRDTVSLLGAPAIRGPREKNVAEMIAPLEEIMGGKVVMDNNTGRFYLFMPGEGRMEIPLVAEGLRKLAMISRLISTGSLLGQGYLFWDEPEANLNPKLIKIMVKTLFNLANCGIQVFIATHSLFLLREIEIQQDIYNIPIRFFGLLPKERNVCLEQGTSLSEISTITALDESLSQSDRYLEMEWKKT